MTPKCLGKETLKYFYFTRNILKTLILRQKVTAKHNDTSIFTKFPTG
jgi:hypothetical protein